MRIKLPSGDTVAAILNAGNDAKACFVFAHGAGADMHHPFMQDMAAGLQARGVATLRFQFPFSEKGSRRPDAPAVAHAAIRAAVSAAARRLPGIPLFAGGKSFGGRMTTQAQADAPLPNVRGIVLFGFPLHPPGKPSVARAEHLSQVKIPMLFLQGTRDELAESALMEEVVAGLGGRAKLHNVESADHAFHVLVKSGRTDLDVREELQASTLRWMKRRLPRASNTGTA